MATCKFQEEKGGKHKNRGYWEEEEHLERRKWPGEKEDPKGRERAFPSIRTRQDPKQEGESRRRPLR